MSEASSNAPAGQPYSTSTAANITPPMAAIGPPQQSFGGTLAVPSSGANDAGANYVSGYQYGPPAGNIND